MTGIYLHIPFCQKKCSYCDFYSLEKIDDIGRFVELLIKEIRLRSEQFPEEKTEKISTVFFGGGTPSLLTPAQLSSIMEELHKQYLIDSSAEITAECNPGTVTTEKLSDYKKSGINRLSFGVQSFDSQELAFLDRIHGPHEAVEALNCARLAGFDNVNMDLMFALPNQKKIQWENNLQTMINLQPEHISAYSLIFEEGTPLYARLKRGEIAPADEEHDAELYSLAIQMLSEAGYKQYETSNFALTGRECRHNLLYWTGENYISFGPSAHGYIRNCRYWNYRNLGRYISKLEEGSLPIANSELLSVQEQMFERAFLELRSQGIRLSEFQSSFGIDIAQLTLECFPWWLSEGLAVLGDKRLHLSSLGYAVCDEISLQLIARLEQKSGNRWDPTSYVECDENAAVLTLHSLPSIIQL